MKARRSTARGAILCGTDFSDRARHAADVAAALAVAFDKPLLLVHVDQGRRPSARLTGGDTARLTPTLNDLRREAARLRQRGAAATEELHFGRPDEELVRCAHDCGASLLVVGSLGHHDGGRWRTGSVAERTAESSRVPILVVRQDTPFEAWLRGDRPLRIFVGFDFTVTSEVAVDWIRTLRGAGPCDITVGHADWPPAERARLGLPAAPALDNDPDTQRALERDVRDRIETLLGADGVQISVHPSGGRTETALIGMAADARADLIVTGTHQRYGLSRLWHASVARGLLQAAPVSVACVPVGTPARRATHIPPIRRVLATTDFSPAGDRAIGHAFALAPRGGAVRLLHVVHPRALSGGQFETGITTTARHTNHVKTLGRQLQGRLPSAAEALGISAEASVVESENVAKAICQEAERAGADVVVIGSEGRSGLRRFVLGSVAQAVMAESRRPVLVVRAPED